MTIRSMGKRSQGLVGCPGRRLRGLGFTELQGPGIVKRVQDEAETIQLHKAHPIPNLANPTHCDAVPLWTPTIFGLRVEVERDLALGLQSFIDLPQH